MISKILDQPKLGKSISVLADEVMVVYDIRRISRVVERWGQQAVIRKVMVDLELTRHDLAQACQMNKRTLDAYMLPVGSQGRRKIPVEKLARILEIYKARAGGAA